MNFERLKEVYKNFLSELIDFNNGKNTSLAFIVNTIPYSPIVHDNEIFQVMSLGGDIFRSALIQKKGNNYHLKGVTSEKKPLLPTKNSFFSLVKKYINPDVNFLCFNFSYPLIPVFEDGMLDGILMHGAKGNEFKGLVHEHVGKTLEIYLAEKYKKNIYVSVANDVICLLLSGLIKYPAKQLAAGIVGSGVNFSFFLDSAHPINLESGRFNNFNPSKEALSIDKKFSQNKVNLFAKEIAGRYLYRHYNLLCKEKGVNFSPLLSTKDLDKIADNSNTEVSIIAKEVLQHSAELVACQIASITAFKEKDMTFVMQGNLFWKGYKYKETVEETIKKLVPQYNISFINVENSDLLGAAKLVL